MKFFMCFDKVEEMKHEGNGKRNKMKKRIVILISVGICTLFFTGCAEEDREVLTSQQASSPLSTVSHEASKRSNQVSIRTSPANLFDGYRENCFYHPKYGNRRGGLWSGRY